MWTQPPCNNKNPFTPFFNPPQKTNSLNYQAVLIFLTVWHHTAQAPPMTAGGLSRISLFPPLDSCMLSAIFSMLEQV